MNPVQALPFPTMLSVCFRGYLLSLKSVLFGQGNFFFACGWPGGVSVGVLSTFYTIGQFKTSY